MRFLKKYYKLIGSVITLLALVFVVKKLVTMDVDWSAFANGRAIGTIGICTLIQTGVILFMTLPWLLFIRILSGAKIPMRDALPVYTRSNLMKYVPGNVFQYVGRNQLAADLQISHVDVACSTLLDIVFCLITPFLLALVLMRKDMLQLFRMYQQNFLIILAAGIAVLILAFLLLHWKFREPLKRYFAKYRKLLSQKAVPQILLVFLLYVAQNLISTAMYAIPAVLLCDVPAGTVPGHLPLLVDHRLHHPRRSRRHRHSGGGHDTDVRQLSGNGNHCPLRCHHAHHLHIRRCSRLSHRAAAGVAVPAYAKSNVIKKGI